MVGCGWMMRVAGKQSSAPEPNQRVLMLPPPPPPANDELETPTHRHTDTWHSPGNDRTTELHAISGSTRRLSLSLPLSFSFYFSLSLKHCLSNRIIPDCAVHRWRCWRPSVTSCRANRHPRWRMRPSARVSIRGRRARRYRADRTHRHTARPAPITTSAATAQEAVEAVEEEEWEEVVVVTAEAMPVYCRPRSAGYRHPVAPPLSARWRT